jgi:hypothetical protein
MPRIEPFQLQRLLGQRVVSSELSSPLFIALRFDQGDTLRVFDSSAEFESFTIQSGGIVV